jgi:hypothetical protein
VWQHICNITPFCDCDVYACYFVAVFPRILFVKIERSFPFSSSHTYVSHRDVPQDHQKHRQWITQCQTSQSHQTHKPWVRFFSFFFFLVCCRSQRHGDWHDSLIIFSGANEPLSVSPSTLLFILLIATRPSRVEPSQLGSTRDISASERGGPLEFHFLNIFPSIPTFYGIL